MNVERDEGFAKLSESRKWPMQAMMLVRIWIRPGAKRERSTLQASVTIHISDPRFRSRMSLGDGYIDIYR